MKKYYKTFPELLMETMHSYRIKRENFKIIEHARHMDDDDEMDADAVILLWPHQTTCSHTAITNNSGRIYVWSHVNTTPLPQEHVTDTS